MDAQQFLAEFGHIANAPGGVQCLREMIYNLAITGDLTRQFPEDGDAQTLLESINFTRQRLIQSKQFKRTAKLESEPLRVPDNITLPTSWCWTRLLDIGEISPRNEAKDDDTAAFIPMSGISQLHNGGLVSEDRAWGEIKKGFTHFANGDVVIAKITPCFENGKAAVIAGLNNSLGIGAGTTELHVFRPIHSDVLPSYVYIFLRSPFFADEGERNMTGTAGQKRLPTGYFATRTMPLPPIAEQVRIIAKVDELMALCDKLEAQQQNKDKVGIKLRNSIFDALEKSGNTKELLSNWQLTLNEFHLLAGDRAAVSRFKNCILRMAVRGQLTEQHASGLDAVTAFIDSVQRKRTILVSDGIVRRTSPLPMIGSGEVPFNVPSGWGFFRLGEVTICRDAQRIPLSKIVRKTRKGKYAYYGASGIIDSIDDFIFDKSLLLIGEDGANLVNRSTPIAFVASGKYWVNNHAHVLDSIDETALRYLEIYINAIDLKPYVTGTAQPKMNQEKMNSIVVAIPPPEEQERIILTVDRLFNLCDSLAELFLHSEKVAQRLSVASISAITGIRTEEEEELKTPKTELISKLRLGNIPDIKEQAPLAAILARHHDEMPASDLWQRYGGDIDAFYAQLKLEVGKGWIEEPAIAEMRETEAG